MRPYARHVIQQTMMKRNRISQWYFLVRLVNVYLQNLMLLRFAHCVPPRDALAPFLDQGTI